MTEEVNEKIEKVAKVKADPKPKVAKVKADPKPKVAKVKAETEVDVDAAVTPSDMTVQVATVEAVKRRRKPANYLNNADMLTQVIESHRINKMTPGLAKMLTLLAKRYGSKSNFANYTYNDDMQAYALMMLCKTWKNFNSDKYSNPFAYYTQCVKNCFRQYLVSEKKHRNIRDKLLVANGMTPSFTYQVEQEGVNEFDGYQFENITTSEEYDTNYDDTEY